MVPENEKDTTKMDISDKDKADMPNVEELLKILIDVNMAQSAQSVTLLLNFMNDIEEQFFDVMEELDTVKAKLNNVQNTLEAGGVKETLTNLSNMTEKSDVKLLSFQEQFTQIKASFNEKAAQAIKNFKENGLVALHNICGFLGIKDTMTALRDEFKQGASYMQGSLDKIDVISRELLETATHAKNIGKALFGKELKETQEARQSGFFHSVKKPYQRIKNVYAGGADKLEKAIAKMGELEQSAKIVAGKRAKPSITQKLQSFKERQTGRESQLPVTGKANKQEKAM